MTAATVVDAVRNRIDVAKDTAEMVGAHLRDVIKLGSQTLRNSRNVVRQARHDTATVLFAARDELRRTLKDGVAQIGDRLARLATPTRKEEALARKIEVKAKKRRKRANQDEIIDSAPTPV
jgi:hypothetical protein